MENSNPDDCHRLLLAGDAGEAILPGTQQVGIWLLWIAAGLTLYTGYDYFRGGLRHVIEDDAQSVD